MTLIQKTAALAVATLGFFALSTGSANAQATTAYAIAGGGTTLIRFNVNNPGAAVAVGNFNGASTFLDTMDFRPANGQLYGYLDATDTVYLVNPNNASLTAVGTGGIGTNTFQLDMDFNPSIDRFRIVTDSNQNKVVNPITGALQLNATDLNYRTTDVNASTAPQIIANAYAGNVAASGFAFQQYAIDYGTNQLTLLDNNTGILDTVGNLGVNTDVYTSFDIYTSLTGVNQAFAVLDTTVGGSAPGLYGINLATGAATPVAGGNSFGSFRQISGLAIVTAVPEANTGALLGMGAGVLGMIGAVLRRKAAK